MSIFDRGDSFFDKIANRDGGFMPRRESPVSKEWEKEFKRKVREKVDEEISPYSPLGEIIHSARRKLDRAEEEQENIEKAPNNLFHIGEEKKKYDLGDHLFVRIGPITHHGIYIGGECVIHFAPVKGSGSDIPKIHTVTLEYFAEGKEIKCLNYDSPSKYSASEVVSRARSRLGNGGYNLFSNNCESFARWCRSGGDEDVWQDD